MRFKSVLWIFVFLMFNHSSAYAKNIFVNKSSHSCNKHPEIYCQLADAIANADDGDEILIGSGIYSEPLVIDKNLSLKANSSGNVIIDAMRQATVLVIEPGVKVKLSNIILQNGKGEKAGGILNYGSLMLMQCIVRDNISLTSGGGIFNASTVSGSMLIESSSIENNVALGEDPNHVKFGGGGIFNNAPMQIMQSKVSNNVAVGNGGGVYSIFSGRTKPTEGQVAAEKLGVVTSKARVTSLKREHQAGSVKIMNTQISDNVAEAGGGIYVQGVLILNGSVVERNSAVFGDHSAGGGVYAHFDVDLEMENTRIRNNQATFIGGGVRFYSIKPGKISNVSIMQNGIFQRFGRGAGLYLVKGTVEMALYNTALTDNYIAEIIPSDCDGPVISKGFNYFSNTARCNLNKVESDFILH